MAEICQFRGADKAVEAYEANDVAPWALFQGSEILCNYKGNSVTEGATKLTAFLEMLKVGSSKTTYQLRVYEDQPRTINNKSPYNLSFRFKLLDDEEYEASPIQGNYKAMIGRIQDLEAKLADKEKEDDEEEKPSAIQGMIAGIINRPEIQEALMQRVIGFINTLMASRTTPAAIAGVPGEGAGQLTPEQIAAAYNNMPADQKQKMDQAIGILVTRDPQIGTNLLKIAMILRDNPNKYQTFAAML
jgi:hypothetical protein